MNLFDRLITLALLSVLVQVSALAQDQAAQSMPESPISASAAIAPPLNNNNESGNFISDIWDKALAGIKNARLRAKINLPTTELAKGLNIGGSYGIQSLPSIGELYSGIDTWEVNLAAYPELFDINPLPGNISPGLGYSRNITYIQQFKTQKESLLRVPYDPITKLPLNSDIFFKKTKNILTGKEELVLKPGDFIGYRAPMTLSLGKGFSKIVEAQFGLERGLSYAITGDFDVQIFVMDNNLVRVKILTAKTISKSISASDGFILSGFSPVGKLIFRRFFNTKILQFSYNSNATDLFIADYIFNLNHSQAKDLYNKLISSKLFFSRLKTIAQQIKIANPITSDRVMLGRLLADLSELNTIADADLDKPYNERRVFKLLNAHNDSKTYSLGGRLRLFTILDTELRTTKTGSKIIIYAQNDNSAEANKYKLDSYSDTKAFNFLIWGDKSNVSSSLLIQTDKQDNPLDFVGLQYSEINADNFLDKKELIHIMGRLQKNLPPSIYSELATPQWHFSQNGTVKNAYIQQDITFNSNLFKLPTDISEQTIRGLLLEIIKKYGQFKSMPMAVQDRYSYNVEDPVFDAYARGKYAEAYSYEILVIPQKLSIVLNGNYTFKERYAAFSFLYEKIPLFKEISTVLLLKVVPANRLRDVVLVRISMSAKGQTPLITDYPNTVAFNTNNLFREILAQNAYINDRSYNLRHYLKEDGSQYSLDEILLNKN